MEYLNRPNIKVCKQQSQSTNNEWGRWGVGILSRPLFFCFDIFVRFLEGFWDPRKWTVMTRKETSKETRSQAYIWQDRGRKEDVRWGRLTDLELVRVGFAAGQALLIEKKEKKSIKHDLHDGFSYLDGSLELSDHLLVNRAGLLSFSQTSAPDRVLGRHRPMWWGR